jgi:hypothetical protein
MAFALLLVLLLRLCLLLLLLLMWVAAAAAAESLNGCRSSRERLRRVEDCAATPTATEEAMLLLVGPTVTVVAATDMPDSEVRLYEPSRPASALRRYGGGAPLLLQKHNTHFGFEHMLRKKNNGFVSLRDLHLHELINSQDRGF